MASLSLALAAVCAFGWWRAAHTGRLALDALGPEERQRLLEEMTAASPGVFAPATFEPAIGYTLRRGRITAWGDTFEANEIGYRTVSLEGKKPAGTLRVLFAGDSWTFGMGVREADAFPHRFEELAQQLGAGRGQRVQAVNLGMPGYNTANQIAALDFFWERVRPDAVVLCPTSNDADSSAHVLANGSLTRQGVERDAFGAGHSIVFRTRLVDSFLFRSRWRANFNAIRNLEERLRSRGVPLFLFFTATWDEAFAHALVRQAGLTSPYVVTPRELATLRWRNREPWGHGNAAAHHLYAPMVYAQVAEAFGWPAAPAPSVPQAKTPVWHPERGLDRGMADGWISEAEHLLAAATKNIAERYVPAPGNEPACTGPMDCATGLSGRATSLLVRRRPGASRLRVTLRRLPRAPSLGPLPVHIAIPSPAGEVTATTTLTAEGPAERNIELPLPPDVAPGTALDIILRAPRAVSSPRSTAPRSFFIVSIEQT